MGLKELGAEIEIEAGYVLAKAKGGYLRGGRVVFPKVSVGATHIHAFGHVTAPQHAGHHRR